MHYRRIQDPVITNQCFRELNKLVEAFSDAVEAVSPSRSDELFNLGGMLACVLYLRSGEHFDWITPFLSGVDSLVQQSVKLVPRNPIFQAFQHPDVPQA